MSLVQPSPPDATLHSEIRRRALAALTGAGSRFLVGGGHAFAEYTGIKRSTKDLDLFVLKQDLRGVLDVLADAGFATEVTFPHWLGKAREGSQYVDLIFSSGNGIVKVDASWFDHAPRARVMGFDVRLIPVVEMIWSKAFVMERDRYDGADIAHLIRHCHDRIDWRRLVDRFGPDWRVLMSHVVLFGYIYPDCQDLVPAWVTDVLSDRLAQATPSNPGLCRGTLLSRWQYHTDLERYDDALRSPHSGLTAEDVALWTAPEEEGRGK